MLLKRPKVLVFDEAVASLDDESMEHIARSVNDLRGKVTVLFVTHKAPKSLKVLGVPAGQQIPGILSPPAM